MDSAFAVLRHSEPQLAAPARLVTWQRDSPHHQPKSSWGKKGKKGILAAAAGWSEANFGCYRLTFWWAPCHWLRRFCLLPGPLWVATGWPLSSPARLPGRPIRDMLRWAIVDRPSPRSRPGHPILIRPAQQTVRHSVSQVIMQARCENCPSSIFASSARPLQRGQPTDPTAP